MFSEICLIKLDRIGKKYNCELFLPPASNKIMNPFYCIDDISRGDLFSFREFLIEVAKTSCKRKFHTINGKKFMEVKW